MAESTRIPREFDSRAKAERPKKWLPPTMLPDPNPEPGYAFRWIRVSTLGTNDPGNISSKLREGWEPVKAEDHPELRVMSDINSQFKGNIEVGGLLLCKAPTEKMKQREQHFAQIANQQMEGVDRNFLRENDPRMPLLNPERSSRTTFGRGK